MRKALLCGEGFEHRKQWIEDRLELLANNFSLSVASFAVMDNHLHVLCCLNPDQARNWSAAEVLRRWMAIYPPTTLDIEDPRIVQAWIADQARDQEKVEVLRSRLQNLDWFMKSLKEPLARLANKEDDCKGAFWEGRYKSIAILDEEALLATCAYIDLNVVAAGIAATPETSPHTSVHQRVTHARKQGHLSKLRKARQGSVAACQAAGNVDQDHWLLPIEDRREHTNAQPASDREGMLEGFSLGSYLLLVNYTGRLFRQGKARLGAGVREIFERLGTSQEIWGDRLKKMLSSSVLFGRYFASQRASLRQLAKACGHNWTGWKKTSSGCTD